jgi:hypothetical protein
MLPGTGVRRLPSRGDYRLGERGPVPAQSSRNSNLEEYF